MLRIHLFGQLALEADGAPFPLRAPPRTGPLLACLLLHRDAPLPRERLAGLLWPDEEAAVARANLRRHLHYLRSALPEGPRWIDATGGRLAWSADAPSWLDVDAYERLRADGASLAEAVGLVRGDLLESWGDDWLIYERERLRTLLLNDLDTLIRSARSRGDAPAAIAFAQRLLALEPLREDVVRQLMALRFRVGDRAGALRTYEAFATLLADDLGVEPMPDSSALYRRMLRNEAPEAPDLLGEAEGDDRRSDLDLPFVGRAAELALATDRWSAAVRGRGTTLLIGGEAGIGKTRLATELALAVESEGGRVLGGATDPHERRPYQSVAEALREGAPLLAAADLPQPTRAALTQLLPELGGADGPERTPPPLDAERERARLFESVAVAFEHLARVRPLLVVLEDLHWAGEATLALVDHLAERAAGAPLLLLGSYREEEVGPRHPLRDLRGRLQREGRLHHVALSPLDRSAVDHLLRSLGEGDGPPTDAAETLYRRSEGNPLVLSALVHDWDAVADDPSAVPESVEGILTAQLDRLDDAPRALIGAAAVVGDRFGLEVVRDLVGWREADVLDALAALLDGRLVEESGRRTGLDFRFRHRLLADAAYRELPEGVRRRRHRRVGRLLEAATDPRREPMLAELARHFELGGEAEIAAGYHLRAARRSATLAANDEALTALDRGLALTDDPALRAALLLEREAVRGRRGERDAQRLDLDAVDAIARDLGDRDLTREALARRVGLERALGRRDHEASAVAALEAAAVGDARWEGVALEAGAHRSFLLGAFDEAVALAERARDAYEGASDEAGVARTLLLDAKAAVAQGRLDWARARLDRVEASPALGLDRTLLFDALRTANVAAMTGQDYTDARHLAERMLASSVESGDVNGEADAHMHLAAAAARLGDADPARDHYATAEALYARLRHRQGVAAVGINRGILDLTQGRYREAAEGLEGAEARFAELGDLRGRALAALNGSVALLYGRAYAEAADASERALEQARRLGSDVFEAAALGNLGDAERNLGRLAEAIDHLTASVALHRRLGRDTDLASSLCELGLALLAAGRPNEAEGVAAELVALHDDEGVTLTHPQYALSVAARSAAAVGDHERAAELHGRARATLDRRLDALDDDRARERYRDLAFNRDILERPPER